jgi:hypothetical protein
VIRSKVNPDAPLYAVVYGSRRRHGITAGQVFLASDVLGSGNPYPFTLSQARVCLANHWSIGTPSVVMLLAGVEVKQKDIFMSKCGAGNCWNRDKAGKGKVLIN